MADAALAGAVEVRPPDVAAPVMVGPDRVTVLRAGSGSARRIVSLIRAARRWIEVEMYEFGKPDLVAALIAAHDRGVEVTVIVDPTVDVTAVTELRLRSHGVDVIEYPVRKMMIDHVKLLVVDGTVAVVGGINWGAGSFHNHDFDIEAEGPVAANLDRVFQRDLVTCGRGATVPGPVPDPAIIVATTLPGADIRPLAVTLIDSARASVDLDLYVLTDEGIVHAVERAAARGVAVRVLLDPSEHPSDAAAAELLAAGVPVRRYRSQGEKLHAKAVIADSRSVLFGSANWSSGGFRRNHELDVEILDSPDVAADFTASMDPDWDASA